MKSAEELEKTIKEIKDLAIEKLQKLFAFEQDRKVVFCKACGLEIFCKSDTEMIERAIQHISDKITDIYWGVWHLDLLVKEVGKNEKRERN